MPNAALDDPVLKRFRAALDEIYGDRVERVVLYGSRARGEAREDSDYDVAVFLKHPDPVSDDLHRLADAETDILYDTGAVIGALPGLTDSAPASCMSCGVTGSICDARNDRLSQ